MCDPMTILAVGSAVVSHGEKQQQATAQNIATRNNYMQQTKQANLATLQNQEAASDKLFRDTISAREAQASYAASVEGMSGSIVGRIMRDKKAVEARNKNNIDRNFQNQLQQTQYELEGLRVSGNGRRAAGPSFLATGLEIGTSVYQGGYLDKPAQQTDYTEY